MSEDNFWVAFGLTLFAGLATGIGSILAFFTKRTNTSFLSISLGFSAGVMIYVSLVEILSKARISLVGELGLVQGNWVTVASFFSGIVFIAIIDKLVPSSENPHEIKKIEEIDDEKYNVASIREKKLLKMGLFSAIVIAIHNLPEGLATFLTAMQDPNLGIPIAFAIAIHNIPEGIAVSVPIFYATGNRGRAFILSFLSGLAEPVGALIGYWLLLPFITPVVFGFLFGAVAGIMVFISLDELLPTAEEYGEHHNAIYGLVAGMAVMAVSLILFL